MKLTITTFSIASHLPTLSRGEGIKCLCGFEIQVVGIEHFYDSAVRIAHRAIMSVTYEALLESSRFSKCERC